MTSLPLDLMMTLLAVFVVTLMKSPAFRTWFCISVRSLVTPVAIDLALTIVFRGPSESPFLTILIVTVIAPASMFVTVNLSMIVCVFAGHVYSVASMALANFASMRAFAVIVIAHALGLECQRLRLLPLEL